MFIIRDCWEDRQFETKEEAKNYFEWKVMKYARDWDLIKLPKFNWYAIMWTNETIEYNSRLHWTPLIYDKH